MPVIADSIDTLSLSTLTFDKFGKDGIKKWRLSPDAICQIAFQLANYRIRGKLSMAYEPALARIFKDGRTETIRSCTPAAAEFVKEMMDKTSNKGKLYYHSGMCTGWFFEKLRIFLVPVFPGSTGNFPGGSGFPVHYCYHLEWAKKIG